MKTCDICEKKVKKLSASRRGRYGLDLCYTCYARVRFQEGKKPPTAAEIAEAARADGPPWSWPLCELCGEDVDQHGLGYYTTKGKPRRHCSVLCKVTANSRAGAPIRSVKARERIKRGLWENPSQFITAAERHEYGMRGGAARAKQHRAEMEAGTWRSPALAPGAREKLGRPRKNVDNPELHRAHEKLTQGARMTELAEEEAAAYREYRRERRAANLEHFRHQEREAYARRMATPDSRARTRAQWKESRERMKQRPPNNRLKQARKRSGLTQTALAEAVSVSTGAVSKWERYSITPRSDEVRRQVAKVLGSWPWPGGDEREDG